MPFHQQAHTCPTNTECVWAKEIQKSVYCHICQAGLLSQNPLPPSGLELKKHRWERLQVQQGKLTLRETSEMSFTVEKRGANALPEHNPALYRSRAESIFCIHTCKTNRRTHMRTAISTYKKRIYNCIFTCEKGGQNNLRAFLAILQRSQRKLNKCCSDWLSTLVFKACIWLELLRESRRGCVLVFWQER